MKPRFPLPLEAESRTGRRETRRTRYDPARLSRVRAAAHGAGSGPAPRLRSCGRARVRGEHGRHCDALTRGHRTDALVVADGHGQQKRVAAFPAPSTLAEQNLGDRHALDLPAVAEDNLGGCQVTACDSPLDECARPPDLIGALECPRMLRTTATRRRIHDLSTTGRRVLLTHAS